MFTWRVDDPRRRNNFLLDLHTEISVHVVIKLKVPSRKGIYKVAGNKNETCNFGPFTDVNKYLSFGTISHQLAVLTPNEVGL